MTAPQEHEVVPARDPTAFATVIDTTQAATRVETLADALGEVSGVQVRRFGGLGDFSTISIRGFSSGQVQVYLDGVPLSRADNDTVNLADLPIDAVDHVEVYRGATPLAFAQASPGGVVNVVTRRPGKEPMAAASASYGSFTTRKADVARAATVGKWDYLAFGHYFGSAGDFPYLNNNGTLTNPTDDQVEQRQNNTFNLGNFTGRIGWHPTQTVNLALTNDTFVKDQGVPGTPPLTTPTANLKTLRQLTHLDADFAPATGVPISAQASGWMVYARDQFVEHDGKPPFIDSDQRTTATGGQVLVRGALGGHQLPGLLLAASHEQVSTSVNPAEPDRTRLRVTVAGQDEILFLDERLALVPALRWEAFRDDFPGTPTQPVARQASGQQTADYLSPRLGVRGEIGYGLALLGNASRSVRPPNLSELFGNQGFIVGNPGLDAERSLAWDVGFRLSLPDQGEWLRAAGVEYAYFDAKVDDLIQLVLRSDGTVKPKNIGTASLSGHEVSTRLRLWDRVGVVANYTHQDTRDEGGGDNTYKGNQLPGRPADEAYVRLEFGWSPEHPLPLWRTAARVWPGQLFFDTNFVADNFLKRYNLPTDHVDRRLLYGAGLRLALPWDRWQVTIEGRNLSDDRTSDVFGFPVPGRSWFTSVSYGFTK